jgi:hypothetical protein
MLDAIDPLAKDTFTKAEISNGLTRQKRGQTKMQNPNCCCYEDSVSINAKRLMRLLFLVAVSVGGSLAAAEAAPPPAAPATAPSTTTTSSSSLADTTIHLYYLVTGYTDLDDTSKTNLCSAPKAELKVGADDGTTLTVAVDTEKANEEEKGSSPCAGKYVTQYHQYTIAKSKVLNASATIQGFVSGVLAVPFKFHLSDHSTTAGSTIGGYVGYRTSVANAFTVTPVIAGGLALISTSAAQVTTSTTSTTTTPTSTGAQTSAGFSVATGFIGSVTSAASKGAQFGVLVGLDWLGKKSNYAYDGKPWIAFEIGYNFAL